MKLQPDLLAAQRWIFPLNRPKRDYQFNISRHCLFDNALVALPTGLGKTFIAGVVMLNFYRWFPEGKLVFVAPTKPLVAQQIDACHKTCGIPGRDAIELTGNNPRAFRSKAWQEKRIFYMTPQTFENDLKTDNCDPGDIVLLVVDEAHKGAGEYSYAKVVRFLMAKNPNFRVLALTATPGRTPEAVQAIVDALHISRIEIRDEQSLDIRGYINEKKVEQHIIAMDEGIGKLRDLLAKVLGSYIKKCIGPGILRGNLDPVHFHPYRANAAMEEIYRRPDGRQLQWAYPLLRKVGTLARAMGYLLEATANMCFRSLTEEAEGGGSDKPSGLNKDSAFQALMDELRLQKSRGFAVHPKLEKLKTLVVNHFGQRLHDDDGSNAEDRSDEGTRAMVFVTFRDAVDEIVAFLNQESPLLRATKFIGQGIDKKGNKGLAQREQLDVIKQFKDGVFNILVATSVGEEGLDIGEVDLIVCYDAQKTPIRMLQRVGRTGRKRQGYVHVLLAEGREEMNWNKAREAYNDVQRCIVRGEQLELYDDVERLLPDHIKPQCLEMLMEIEEYDRSATEKSRESTTQDPSKKRKRNNDPTRDIPPGACAGFVSVAELLVKQTVKRRKKGTKFNENAGLDDDTDEEIEAGLFAPRRAASTSAATSAKPPKTKLKRAKTAVDGGKKRQTTRKKTKACVGADIPESSPSQFLRKGADDSDDMAIERGRGLWNNSRPPSPKPPPDCVRSSSPDIPLAQNQSIIDICTSAAPSPSPSPRNKHRYSTPPRPSAEVSASRHPSPSPPKFPSVSPSDVVVAPEPSFDDAPPSPSKGAPDQGTSPETKEPEVVMEDDSLAWLLADSDDSGAMASSPAVPRSQMLRSPGSDTIEIEDPENGSPIVLESSPVRASGPPMPPNRDKPPPPVPPLRLRLGSPSPVGPSPSLPVRAVGQAKRRPVIAPASDASSPLQLPPPSQKRLYRRSHSHDEDDDCSPSANASPTSHHPPKKKRKLPTTKRLKVRDTAEAARAIPWIDVEAIHSGDEVSGGGLSSSQEDEEDEQGERMGGFVTDLPATQPPASYDQSAVYRQSLLSQAPVRNTGSNRDKKKLSVPVFAAPPARRNGVPLRGPPPALAPAPAGAAAAHHDHERFSSPPVLPDEEDYYSLGSFVVDDEAEISFIQSSEP
ncbi:P-loop containing nucleoside triphosphate hydrolase protein [Russula emetica]|nr:P-loop containing nucleoside triphosphate hydrolase protein [Russula emetica]